MNAFSIDLIGEFALFKKNDANAMVHISYNFIHRPVLLGMFGAVLGYSGYSQSNTGKMPEYYNKLCTLKVAIEPFYSKPLKKVVTGFNNASGMGSDAGTWQIKEQILVGEPEIKFRIFILEHNDEKIQKLKSKFKKRETEFLLYYGKNEFFAHYENFQEWDAQELEVGEYNFHSLIRKRETDSICFRENSFENFDPFDFSSIEGYTIYENLPYDFDEFGFYKKDLFILTQRKMQVKQKNQFYELKNDNGGLNVQFI